MNIIPNHLRMSHLQNIIDQAPKSDTARRAREIMESIRSLPERIDDYAICPQAEIGKDEVAG